mgnify:CR=1 FL=1
MKTIKIYERTILERTGFKKHPFKEVTQYIICYNGEIMRNGHIADYDNENLKVPFKCVLSTRNKDNLFAFFRTLRRTNADEWLKMKINFIMVGVYK